MLHACKALCPVCHVYIDLMRCHSQCKAAKGQCGPLFLSERKNELSAPACSSWDGRDPPGHTSHLPALPPAEASIAQHPLSGPLALCAPGTPHQLRS